MKNLSQHRPTELSVMMERSYICTVQCNSYLSYAATEHLKCGYCNRETKFQILIEVKFKELYFIRDYHIEQHSPKYFLHRNIT